MLHLVKKKKREKIVISTINYPKFSNLKKKIIIYKPKINIFKKLLKLTKKIQNRAR